MSKRSEALPTPVRCLVLLSGGLDSTLAAKLLMQQGIEVVAVTFSSPFFGCERGSQAARRLGIRHRVIDITAELTEVIRSPKHGYGRHANPCIDCHALMVRKAAALLEEEGAAFVATGEVLDERPKSQRLGALETVEEESGLVGRLVRPLSAKLLAKTVPEREGLIDRERLEAIRGRSRKRQLELAKALGVSEFPTPGGGCRLTEEATARRLKMLLERRPDADASSFALAGVGRHVWVGDSLVVCGRNHADNARIEEAALPGDLVMRPVSGKGPTTLVRWPSAAAEEVAVAMTARYGQERDAESVEILVLLVGDERERVVVSTSHRGRVFPLVG